MEQYVQEVRQRFAERGNPAVAEAQMAYMKHHFAFFGLKMPVWRAMSKDIFQQYPMPNPQELTRVVEQCYNDEHREMHYFALELTERCIKKQPPEAIELLEWLIVTNSWWDSVDWIAKMTGIHFRRYPDLVIPTTERWMASNNMWLQRVCVIFQLHYKAKTDSELLFKYIRQVAHSKEFFLQKAAGWALRQYAEINPDAVRQFVATHQLAPLTQREALRKID